MEYYHILLLLIPPDFHTIWIVWSVFTKILCGCMPPCTVSLLCRCIISPTMSLLTNVCVRAHTFVNRDIVRGIIQLHDNEIVHGGIRPHNILVKTYQTIRIVPKSGGMSKCKIWKYFILICYDYSICIEEQGIVHSGSLQYGPYYFN